MQMPVNIAAKSPQDCSPGELRDFATLVLAGGEVIREGLEARVSKAHALFFSRESSCLLGIAALKKPAAGYRVSLLKKAGATVSPSQCVLELGWVFVTPSARGRNLSHRLTRAAVDYAGSARVFATSRTDNPGMHAPLLAASFKKHGHDYASDRGAHRLELFLRDLK
jgi:hypothetical protein